MRRSATPFTISLLVIARIKLLKKPLRYLLLGVIMENEIPSNGKNRRPQKGQNNSRNHPITALLFNSILLEETAHGIFGQQPNGPLFFFLQDMPYRRRQLLRR